MKELTFPVEIGYTAACMQDMTRKVEGGFEACAAIFFGGKRVKQANAVAATRSKALAAAKAQLNSIKNAIEQPIGNTMTGRVSRLY